jgi:hypothetical protein
MSERLKAAEQLENRGMGKPKDHLETSERSPVDDALDGLTTEQLLSLWDRLGPGPEEPEH